MGLYGEYCPKPLMVAYNQSLLHRNLSFLASAGFHQIIVSTRESLYERIYQHVDSISKKMIIFRM
jgi:NDP-sugar pyrophosphorylase family protein